MSKTVAVLNSGKSEEAHAEGAQQPRIQFVLPRLWCWGVLLCPQSSYDESSLQIFPCPTLLVYPLHQFWGGQGGTIWVATSGWRRIFSRTDISVGVAEPRWKLQCWEVCSAVLEKRRRMSLMLPTPDRTRGLVYSSNYCQMIDHWSLSCPNPAKDHAGKYTFTQAGRAEEKRSSRNIYEKVSWISFRIISGKKLLCVCITLQYLTLKMNLVGWIKSKTQNGPLQVSNATARLGSSPLAMSPSFRSLCFPSTKGDHSCSSYPYRLQCAMFSSSHFHLLRKCQCPVWKLLMCACPTMGLQH